MSFKLKKFIASLTAFVLSAGIMSFTVSAHENTAAGETAAAENSGNADEGKDSGSEKELFFADHFDDGHHSWTGRGGAKLSLSDEKPFDGINCLSVTGRTAAWNGAQKELDLTLFEPGKTYSFSCNAMQTAGGAEETFYMKLQYTDAAGQTNYDAIAEATTIKGEWVQLANSEYTIPADATAAFLYVETKEGTFDFYVDNAAGAGEATQIEGPKSKKLTYGDINYDGKINIPDLCLIKSALIDGLTDDAQKKAADVNRDKSIDATDAMLIFQWLNAEIEEFPQPPKPENEWDDYQETASAEWINFYKSSILSMGNTARLAAKLDAASQGEPLTLAYLGGSITEGKNYSSPFSSYIKNNFCKGTFKEVNAGLSGTSSVVGLVRSEKDICSQNPDIVVIEFSVNDHEDIMYKKCFESCIKKFLSL
ncbi:MAG: carbohydrate binding domain-containing protein, partial [Oscillospiraceae bacterium]|nr:carbohydrate binding domain-containing protein [Oscillospiraceae bacterium]